jgi:Fungal Zn(2)-Cys(6) binuclear cluster domain
MKRHAACDDCRKRKLKCSGEVTGCTRCVKNSLICVYSEQKQMGRPKKRQRKDDTRSESLNAGARVAQSDAMIDPILSPADVERTNFQNVCNAPVAQAVRQSAASLSQGASSMNTTPRSDHPHTPPDIDIFATSYPTDYSLWPDFSDTNLPQPVIDGFKPFNDSDISSSEQSIDPDANPIYLQSLPSVPDCPCLPNLYLTLSTLSTLSSFPVSSHTLATLLSAHRTARSVLYCPVCPQKFQSGSQNVMLSGTLLTVLVDQWQRVLKSPSHNLRKGFGDPTDDSPILSIPDLEWRTFAYDLIRHYVFGDRPLPIPPNSTSSRNTSVSPDLSLMSLANAMERRQKQWHSFEPPTGEFPERLTPHLAAGHTAGLTLEEIRKYERDNVKENNHLCLQLCKHTKMCIRSLDRAVPTLERTCG